MEGTIGPRRSAAAEEHAVWMAVLATGYGAEIGDVPHLLAIGGKLGIGRPCPGLAQVLGYEEVGDLQIAFVRRIEFAVIDVVAIEVVPLLGDAPRPGEAV